MSLLPILDYEGEAVDPVEHEISHCLDLSGFIIDKIKVIELHGEVRTPDLVSWLGKESWKCTLTERGHSCTVRVEAQEEDQLGLFQGARCPLLLRECDNADDVENMQKHNVSIWKLVGECYVEKMMDGSMFDVKKCSSHWLS